MLCVNACLCGQLFYSIKFDPNLINDLYAGVFELLGTAIIITNKQAGAFKKLDDLLEGIRVTIKLNNRIVSEESIEGNQPIKYFSRVGGWQEKGLRSAINFSWPLLKKYHIARYRASSKVDAVDAF